MEDMVSVFLVIFDNLCLFSLLVVLKFFLKNRYLLVFPFARRLCEICVFLCCDFLEIPWGFTRFGFCG